MEGACRRQPHSRSRLYTQREWGRSISHDLEWEAYAARSSLSAFMFHRSPQPGRWGRLHTYPCLRRSRFETDGRLERPHLAITCVVAYEAAMGLAITGYASADDSYLEAGPAGGCRAEIRKTARMQAEGEVFLLRLHGRRLHEAGQMDMDSVTTLPGQLFPKLVGRVCATGAINRIFALQPQAGACARFST